MLKPNQPQLIIRIFKGKRAHLDSLKGSNIVTSVDSDYIDVENFIAYPVVYKEEASLLNTLSFTIDKYADVLLYYLHIGQTIILYGGYYADNQSGMRHVFSGTITRIKTKFSNSGKVSIMVECMNYGFTKLGKDLKNFVYPDQDSSRKFAASSSLSVKDIISGIADDNKIDLGIIDLSSSARAVNFDKINIRYQKNMSDWQFLNRLAVDFGCSVWISTENGSDKLNFVSNEKAFRLQSDIQFLFPLYGITNKALNWDSKIQDNEIQKFSDPAYNRPRIIRDVVVDEDISQAYAVSRSAMYYDKKTGEYKEVVSKIETDKDGNPTGYVTFYELDESRVEYIHRTRPDIADKFREGSPTSMKWGDPKDPESASYYYRAIQRYNSNTAVFDRAFFGITVTAKCNQDLDIHSQRTYRIRGILSYHSKDLNTSFFLRGLSHVWDSDGTWTELDFIR